MRYTPKRAAVVASGIIALLLVIWVSTKGEGAAANAATVVESSASTLAIRAVAVRVSQWQDTMEAFGNIVPWDEIILSAQVADQPLVEVRAKVGDRVRKGQLLARFDAEMLRAEALRLRAEVAQASAEVSQARTEQERAVLLAEGGGVSEQEVLQRDTAAQVAFARLASAQAQLSIRALDLQRSQIVAPDDGTVSARHAQTGMIGTAGLELFRIIRRDRLEWRGEVTALQLGNAAAGQPVLLSLPGGAQARARIRHIGPALDVKTRLGTLFADIEPGGTARAGTYVSGQVVLGQRPALVVPASGVVVRDGYSYAFKLEATGGAQHVRQQRVELGRRRGPEVEIVFGLAAGDRIVEQGAGFLDDGDSVRVMDGPDAPRRDGSGAP